MAEPKFEKDLEKLEGIVQALEEGELSLDESLARFEEGIKLARNCEKALTRAEKRIEILTKNAEGELEAQPFGEEEETESDKPPAKAPKAAKRGKRPSPEEEDSGGEDEEEDGELLF